MWPHQIVKIWLEFDNISGVFDVALLDQDKNTFTIQHVFHPWDCWYFIDNLVVEQR